MRIPGFGSGRCRGKNGLSESPGYFILFFLIVFDPCELCLPLNSLMSLTDKKNFSKTSSSCSDIGMAKKMRLLHLCKGVGKAFLFLLNNFCEFEENQHGYSLRNTNAGNVNS